MGKVLTLSEKALRLSNRLRNKLSRLRLVLEHFDLKTDIVVTELNDFIKRVVIHFQETDCFYKDEDERSFFIDRYLMTTYHLDTINATVATKLNMESSDTHSNYRTIFAVRTTSFGDHGIITLDSHYNSLLQYYDSMRAFDAYLNMFEKVFFEAYNEFDKYVAETSGSYEHEDYVAKEVYKAILEKRE